jgi:hypothetical protein
MRSTLLLSALLACGAAVAGDPPPVDTAALVTKNTYAFTLGENGELAGPGADFLKQATADAQFVLFGESHHDFTSPQFAAALYRMLHADHGFDTVVVEQDPLAIEAIGRKPLKGDAKQIATLSQKYPTHLGFSSDQDLGFLATASGLGHVWGLEQAQGASRYLDELQTLAPNGELKGRVTALLEEARKETRTNPGAFLHDDTTTLGKLDALRKDFHAKAGSRADVLLQGLATSALIYSYNHRAMDGEYVGLYNNTEREALFKQGFVRHYRAEAKGNTPLKALFKFGNWHMYHGKSPGQAYTIGNFAHEFAIWNAMRAYGISVMPFGGYDDWKEVPAWMKPLLPAQLPEAPVLIDLRPLKPYGRPFRLSVADADQWEQRDFLQGYDAIVILPHSKKATWDLTGFPVP